MSVPVYNSKGNGRAGGNRNAKNVLVLQKLNLFLARTFAVESTQSLCFAPVVIRVHASSEVGLVNYGACPDQTRAQASSMP